MLCLWTKQSLELLLSVQIRPYHFFVIDTHILAFEWYTVKFILAAKQLFNKSKIT